MEDPNYQTLEQAKVDAQKVEKIKLILMEMTTKEFPKDYTTAVTLFYDVFKNIAKVVDGAE